VIGPAIGECSAREQSARVHAGLVASPIEWYHGTSPWGSAVAAPSSIMGMFTDVVAEFLLPRVARTVALWGAMELCFHGEPIVCGADYAIEGEVVALGQTPKTETLWYDLGARDARGDLVATTRVLTRFAKASSPLYDEE
jgi:hypothetical protein